MKTGSMTNKNNQVDEKRQKAQSIEESAIEALSGHLSFIGVNVVSREYHSTGILPSPTSGWGIANMLIFAYRLGSVKVVDRNIDLVELEALRCWRIRRNGGWSILDS